MCMSEIEEDKILEEVGEELPDLEEKPKSFLVLVAVILGTLSLILSFIALKQGESATPADLEKRIATLENPPIGEATQIEGAVGAADIHTQLQELKQELAEMKTSPVGLNAGLNAGLAEEVASLKAQVAALKSQVSNSYSALPHLRDHLPLPHLPHLYRVLDSRIKSSRGKLFLVWQKNMEYPLARFLLPIRV